MWKAIALGQVVSLLICSAAVICQVLVENYSVRLPAGKRDILPIKLGACASRGLKTRQPPRRVICESAHAAAHFHAVSPRAAHVEINFLVPLFVVCLRERGRQVHFLVLGVGASEPWLGCGFGRATPRKDRPTRVERSKSKYEEDEEQIEGGSRLLF